MLCRVASVRFSFVSRLLFLCSGFVFYAPVAGGGLLCFSFGVHRTGVLRCLSLPPSEVFCSFFFVLLSVFLLPFGLGLALSVTSVSGTCFCLSFSLLYAPALFSLRQRRGGGWSAVLFVFCESEWYTPMFLSSNLRSVFSLSIFPFALVFLCR